MTTPFPPNKKVPIEYAGLFDKEDYGYYFVEDQPVMTDAEAERLREKYKEHLKQQEGSNDIC